MNAGCELLEWDSTFFGCRIARVVGHRLDDAAARAALDWCEREAVACLYFLADADDAATTAAAEAHGFGMKDIRVTSACDLDQPRPAPAPDGPRVRPASRADADAIEAMAAASYTDSRFYFDTRFPRERVSGLYRRWARQSVEGGADQVLVLEQVGRPAGFITCHLLPERQGSVGLGCVDAAARGQGLGAHLYGAALDWFASRGVRRVSYVTQGRNVRAQRLIQRLGFRTESVRIWYHRWFDGSAPTWGE